MTLRNNYFEDGYKPSKTAKGLRKAAEITRKGSNIAIKVAFAGALTALAVHVAADTVGYFDRKKYDRKVEKERNKRRFPFDD